jgi:hypothetical protein
MTFFVVIEQKPGRAQEVSEDESGQPDGKVRGSQLLCASEEDCIHGHMCS